ncbi:MAG: AAA family ATPase [Actinomycetota bacterium]|nr:AAA family ATPase [Actinomycetota bacterium]
MPRCGVCGEDNPERAKFCLNCGATLQAAPAPSRETRKTVTVVFSDVTGSTQLGERLDPETLRRLMSRYFAEMKTVLERHGGTVEKFIGDAVMAVFGIPVLHEDDALRACRAAVEMREALAAMNKEVERDLGVSIVARTGVNTGEVVAGDPAAGQTLVTGDAVNTAARLEQAAPPGDVLIGDPTYRLVRDAVVAEPVEPVAAKGKAEPVPAYRLLEVHPTALGHARRLDSPMVGRDRELNLLLQAFDRTSSERSCHLFTVLGSAGVGKSRLVAEFLGRVGDRGTVLRGRCLPYGEGITFWPVAEAVKQAAGIEDGDTPERARERIAELVASEEHGQVVAGHVSQVLGLIADSAVPEETFWAIRALFEALARRRPVVLVLDDVHWGEATLLDLVEHIADWSRDAPILLVCLARPELLDARPAWGGGKMNSSSILLEPLSAEDASTLVHNLVGAADLPTQVADRITEAAEGNPLFVEEMLGMLIDEGLLVREGGAWAPVGDLSTVSVPPTIQALLAARLDRLGIDQRAVIERASVVGKEFWRGAVMELTQEPLRPAVPESLMALVRKELIRPGRSAFAGDEAFRFRHLLIRDAAYDSIPKEVRAELHERFAAWLERATGDRVVEYEEILAYHLEETVRYRSELGQTDQRTAALGEEAAERLASAGRRALARGDMTAAANLLGRAVKLLPNNSEFRAWLLPDLVEARIEHGDLASGVEALDEADRAAEALGDVGLGWRARILRAFLNMSMDPSGSQASALPLLEQADRELDAIGDVSGRALVWNRKGLLLFWLGSCAEGLEAMEQALALARAAADRRVEIDSLALLFGPLLWGPTPVNEAERAARGLQGTQRLEAFALGLRSYLAALTGRADEARALSIECLRILRDIGNRLMVAVGQAIFVGEVFKLAEDLETAERIQRAGVDELAAMGETGYLSTAAGYLADTLLSLGKPEEASRYVEMARDLGQEDDFSTQVLWRRAHGLILSRQGRHEEAEATLRDSLAIVERSDYLVEHADVLAALAEALGSAGRPEEAARRVRQAIAMYERKGATLLADRARSQLAELESHG